MIGTIKNMFVQSQIGLEMSIVKLLSANWFMSAFDSTPDIVALKLLEYLTF